MFGILQQPASKYRQLLRLGVPILLQNLISSSLAMVDTAMVGTLGQNELAGLSLANTPFFVAMLFVFGLQSGGAVLISQYWGKKDLVTINRVLGLSCYAAGGLSLLFAAVVTTFPMQVMGLTSNNAELVSIAARYGRIVAPSYFLNALVSVYVGAQRSIENPKFGMVVFSSSMTLNVIFNYILIFGKLGLPAMGVEGAALATLLSRIMEVVITGVYMAFVDKRLPIRPKAFFRPGKIIFADYIRYSTPVVINETVWGLGTSMFPVIYGHMERSSDIVSAYSIAGNIDRILSVLCFALANAAAVIIGKEIGEGRPKEEVQRTGGWLLVISVLGAVGTALLLLVTNIFLGERVLFPLFNLEPNARRIASMMLFVMVGMAFPRYYNTSMIVGLLRGGGDVKTSMIIDTTFLWLLAVPLAAFTGLVLRWDILWVYLLIQSEEIFKCLAGIWRYMSGKWIRNITRDFAELEEYDRDAEAAERQ